MRETTFNVTKQLLTEAGGNWEEKHDVVVRLANVLVDADYFTEPKHVIWYFEAPYKYDPEYEIWDFLGQPGEGDKKWDTFVSAMGEKDHSKVLRNLKQYGTIHEPEEPD